MRKSISFLLGVMLAVMTDGLAQIPIQNLPNATLPLSGSEQVIVNQGNPAITKKTAVSNLVASSTAKPAGSFQAFFQSGDIQWNNLGAMFGTDQFILGLAIPLPDGTNGDALLLGSGYGPGGPGNPGKAWIITDQAFDNITPGNTLGITAGETQGAGTANGGLLWLLGGASFGGKGGNLLVQGGTSANGAGGDTIVQGGNATGPTAAAIPGDLFLEAGQVGRQGANVQLIMTTLNGISGVVRIRNNSTFLWDFFADGSLFSYLGGGFGTSGQVLKSQGVGLPAQWASIAAGADKQVIYNNSGNLAATSEFGWNYTNDTMTLGAAARPPIIVGGPAGTVTSAGFQFTIRGAPGGATSGTGGTLNIAGGIPSNGIGGSVQVIAANGVGTTRAGGGVNITAGDGSALGTAAGGAVNIKGGFGGAASGAGGGIFLTAGPAANATGGIGGPITLLGGIGQGGHGGDVNVTGGDGSQTGDKGGDINITSGGGNAGGNAGNINIQVGAAVTTAAQIFINAGSSITLANQTWTLTSPTTGTIQGVNNQYTYVSQASTSGSASFGPKINAGTTAADIALDIFNATGVTNYLRMFGDGGTVVGSATGGDKGFASLNIAGNYYQNNVQLIPSVQCTTACSVAGMPVGQTARVMKTAATNRASTTTPTADPDLQFTNVPVGRYEFHMSIDASVVNAVGLQVAFGNITNTAGNVVLTHNCTATPTTVAAVTPTTLTGSFSCSPTFVGTSGIHITLDAGVLVSGVSTVSFNWAQVSSSATNTAVNQNSYVEITRLQ